MSTNFIQLSLKFICMYINIKLQIFNSTESFGLTCLKATFSHKQTTLKTYSVQKLTLVLNLFAFSSPFCKNNLYKTIPLTFYYWYHHFTCLRLFLRWYGTPPYSSIHHVEINNKIKYNIKKAFFSIVVTEHHSVMGQSVNYEFVIYGFRIPRELL